MLLAIDIGNTRLKWALYRDRWSGAASVDDRDLRPGAVPLAQGAVFIEHVENLADDEWAKLPAPSQVLGCCVAGDAVRHRVEEQLELWDVAPSWVVSSASEAGVSNGYDHPLRLGSDRWVALIGARHHLLARGDAQRPLLVVMIGTAVTVDALDASGRFLGGLILPGHGIMLRALEGGTAGLRVPTGEVALFPTNTSDALTSGGTYAITGAIERMARHIVQHCGAAPCVILSGGAGWKVAPWIDLPHEQVDTLIFDGLIVIANERERVRAIGK